MIYIAEVVEIDKFITVWNFGCQTVFMGFISEEAARLKASGKIGMWKIKKLK